MIIKIAKSEWMKLSSGRQVKLAYNSESFKKVYPNIPSNISFKFIELFNKIPSNQKGLINYFNKLMRTSPKTEADALKITEDISKQIIQPEVSVENPTDVTNTPNSLVNQVSQNKEERDWINKLIKNKEINPQEDFPKIKQMLDELKDYNSKNLQGARSISSFNNDKELFKFLNSLKNEVAFELPAKGAKELASETINESSVKLIQITQFSAMAKIGENSNWCVARREAYDSSTYKDHNFHCFVIDGVPELLIHKGSGQIKDTNDAPISNLNHVQLIRKFVDQFDLNANDGDFEKYNKLVTQIDEFEANKNNPEWTKNYLSEKPERISFWGKDSINMMKYIYTPEAMAKIDIKQVPKSILANIGTYNSFAKNSDIDSILTVQVLAKGFVDDAGNINTNKYFKNIPDSVKNPTVSQIFKSLKETEDKKVNPETSSQSKHLMKVLFDKISNLSNESNISSIFAVYQIYSKLA